MNRWRKWFIGLIHSMVTMAAGAGALVFVEPLKFNLDDGLPLLLKTTVVLAAAGVYNWLQKSPMPFKNEEAK